MTYRLSGGSAQPKVAAVHPQTAFRLISPPNPFHAFWDLLNTKSAHKKGPETRDNQTQLFRTRFCKFLNGISCEFRARPSTVLVWFH